VVEPVLSVVIPTRDRWEMLTRCLTALDRACEGVDGAVEVLVADDASVEAVSPEQGKNISLRVLRRETAGGSSAARNLALSVTSAPLVLFIDDDIEVEFDLVERHIRHHELHSAESEALVGLVTWTRARPVTAHMRWLEKGGPLFAFDTIKDPGNVDAAHFCTANVSVKRSLLGKVAGPFDERLRRFTDVELGVRLAGAGMRLRYDPLAVAWHLRHDTPASTDDRMRVVGEASVVLDSIHPGLAPPAAPYSKIGAAKATVARGLSPFAPVMPEHLADRVWSSRAAWAYAEGRRRAERTAS